MFNSLPLSSIRNIKIFYLLNILGNAWFVLPNWMFLFGLYLTKSQIGFVDSLGLLFNIALQIPSGLISDLFGKKKTLIFGYLCLTVGAITIGLSSSLIGFFIGNSIGLAGFAFISGAFDAFAYDSLVEIGEEKKYAQVTAKATSLGIIMSVVTMFAGGVLFAINPRLPFLVWSAFELAASIILLFSIEPKIDTETVNIHTALEKLKDGMTTIFSVRFRDILIPILIIVILAKTHQGVVRQSMAVYFTFSGETFSYILAITMIPVLFVAHHFDQFYRQLGIQKLMFIILAGYFVTFVFGTLTHTIIPGILYFVMIMIGEKLSQQILTVGANERLASSHRATALSVLALITQIPYIVLMFFFANLTETDQITHLISGFAFVAVLAAVFTAVAKIRRRQQVAQVKN